MLKRILPLLMIVFALPFLGAAQVTTGSLTGTVTTPDGKPLGGASVTAVHVPSGTKYKAISTDKGLFNIPGMRVGGPYTLTAEYVGYTAKTITDLSVALGNALSVNISLEAGKSDLKDVVVSAEGQGALIGSQRMGTAVLVSSATIQSLPSISRSVQDIARLTPQARVGNTGSSGLGTGISFGGQNNRYNQFSIDGANASDGFGLSSNGNNGGQANLNPISMEAIQEMQIVLSPYDVTQGGFVGGGINAVTKSGTNDFHGSVYGNYQNQGFVGKSVPYSSGVVRNSEASFTNRTIGASFSGAIVKNKLFFFADVESYKKSIPLPYDPTNPNSGSKVSAAVMDSISNFLKTTYNYDPGSYGAINARSQSTSVFARLDWNINDKNKLMFRFNHVNGTTDASFTGADTRTPTSAYFANGGYVYRDNTNSYVAELNSNISSRASNMLRFTYTSVIDNNGSGSTPFPNITIDQTNPANGANIIYNIGTDISYGANGLQQHVATLTDNYTIYADKHTITIGTTDQYFSSNNIFLQNYFGTYVYKGASNAYAGANLQNFINNTGLYSYAVGYSTSANPSDKANAILHAAQLGVYAQDVFKVSDVFKLTYGLRIDAPVFFNKPAANAGFNTAFAADGVATNQMPKFAPLFSPRVGFNWRPLGEDKSLQIRGGVGLFTGTVPYVWISNNISQSGVTSLGYSASTPAAVNAAGIQFQYNPSQPHDGAYIPGSSTPVATAINVVAKDFKFPQVLRGNLAADQQLGIWGLIGTAEFIYTKTLNNAYYQNLNITQGNQGDQSVAIANTTRPYWTHYLNTGYQQVIELSNTSAGHAMSATVQVQKPRNQDGWSGSLAYTYGTSTSLNDLTSSVATSNWKGVYNINGLNNPDMAKSNYDLGNRIVGFISKEFNYSKHASTAFTLFYTGQSGQRFSYIYNVNLNGDYVPGTNSTAASLVYIPNSLSQANFADITSGGTTVTASQQWTNFQNFMASDKYLSSHQGQNSVRNGDRLPFENHFDFRIAQNFKIKQYQLQIFFDVINIGNLLNKNWGWSYGTSTTSDGLYTASTALFNVVTGAQTQNGVAINPTVNAPAFQFNQSNFTQVKNAYRPYLVEDFTSRWNSQIGVKFSF